MCHASAMLRNLALLFAVALLGTARVCSAQFSAVESIDRDLQRNATTEQFSGAILIAKGGRVLLDKGYGRTIYPSGGVNTGETRFRIGSLTKQFTAAAILQLRDEGKLSLDDSVCSYVQPCPAGWSAITLFHLLSHTSGIPSYTAQPGYANIRARPVTPAQLLALIEPLPLGFVPGSAFEYGDSGYLVLGVIIEKVSGNSYAGFLKTRILEPLGMSATGCTNLSPSDVNAQGYLPGSGGLSPASAVDASAAFSSAGMYSSTRDLSRWARALMSDRILSNLSRKEMFTPGLEDFGFGWIVPKSRPVTYLHLGELAGFESAIFVLPQLGVVAVVLSNIEGMDIQPLAADGAIAGAYAEYEGDYALSELKKTLRVFVKGGALKAQTGRGSPLVLDYVSGDSFVALHGTESEVRIDFTRNDAGEVVGVRAEQFGKRFSGTRNAVAGPRVGGATALSSSANNIHR